MKYDRPREWLSNVFLDWYSHESTEGPFQASKFEIQYMKFNIRDSKFNILIDQWEKSYQHENPFEQLNVIEQNLLLDE